MSNPLVISLGHAEYLTAIVFSKDCVGIAFDRLDHKHQLGDKLEDCPVCSKEPLDPKLIIAFENRIVLDNIIRSLESVRHYFDDR